MQQINQNPENEINPITSYGINLTDLAKNGEIDPVIGREDEIQDVGMFLTLDLPWAGPVAVCRANDMNIYAFANSCKHRGAMILQEKHEYA